MYRKYLRWYIALIRNRQINNLEPKGNHKHHIFPKSIFRNNKVLVVLTPREHFVAHRLLARVYELRYGLKHNKTIKMKYAFSMMVIFKEIHFNSRMYALACKSKPKPLIPGMLGKKHSEEARKKISTYQKSKIVTEETRKRQSMSLKGKVRTEETRKRISEVQKCKKISESQKQNIAKTMSCSWLITFPDGHTEIIKNLHQFSKQHKLNSRIYRKGKCKGFKSMKL